MRGGLVKGEEEKIPARSLAEFPAAVARRVLRQMALAARGTLEGITYEHIESMRGFAAHAQSGRRLLLKGGLEARKEFDWLILAPHVPEERWLRILLSRDRARRSVRPRPGPCFSIQNC